MATDRDPATGIILVLVPVVYYILEDVRAVFGRIFGGEAPAGELAPGAVLEA